MAITDGKALRTPARTRSLRISERERALRAEIGAVYDAEEHQ